MVHPAPEADTAAMNVYHVLEMSGERHEIEADFYQQAGDELVFISGGEEVVRIVANAVQGLTRVRIPNDRMT